MVGGEEPRAKIAQLDLPGMAVRSGRSSAVSAGTRGSDARWPEQQPTPAFGFEKHFAMELTEMASPSAGRRVSGASADNSENNLATEMTQMTLTASSAHRMSADSSGKQRWPTELTEITSASAWRMSADADSSQDLEAEMAGMASPSAWRMIADSSEEEEREEPRGSARPGPAGGPPLEVVAGATATYVGRLLAGSLARGAARSCADAAPQATPDAGARKASARGSLVGEVGRGDFEGASVDAATEEYAAAATLRDDEVTPGARSRVASVRHPPPASWLSGAADGGVPESALEEGGAATTLQVDEVKSSVRSVKASVRCVLSDAVDKGVLESALEVKPETRFLKASVRGLLSDAVDQGALERGLADEGAAVAPRAAEAELPLATPRARVRQLLVGSHRSGALQAELARLAPAVAVEAAPLKASVRGLLSDAVDQGALERGLADGPPGGLPPASLEACLATNHAMELLGRDALDAGLERRLAQATAREEMAYRAALGECERLKAELAATVSAELGRAGLLGIGEAVPSAPAAARTEPMPRGAVAAVAAAHGGAARGGLRGQVERVHEQASTVFAEMERRCRRLQQELVEQAAVARAPRSGPAGAQEAPLVCELRRECERLRADLAGAVLAERQAAREAARLRGQGALGEMRREWEHLRKELGGCLRELGGHSASLPEPAAPEPPRRAGGRRAAGPGGGELLLPVASC
ncbi:unnamed protein product [Prorocentrum cordatum]|uniref:Centrosomal protein of 70 kDa n=1 Tax=Prorocentrum cordatum TaxID=2364126 RepID=A0ABN9VVW0_9DINO|nr:unnamed protein product [Polarella glacialis]